MNKRERGQGLLEYILILVLILISVVVVLSLLGPNLMRVNFQSMLSNFLGSLSMITGPATIIGVIVLVVLVIVMMLRRGRGI